VSTRKASVVVEGRKSGRVRGKEFIILETHGAAESTIKRRVVCSDQVDMVEIVCEVKVNTSWQNQQTMSTIMPATAAKFMIHDQARLSKGESY